MVDYSTKENPYKFGIDKIPPYGDPHKINCHKCKDKMDVSGHDFQEEKTLLQQCDCGAWHEITYSK